MVRMVRRLSSTAEATPSRSPEMRVMSAEAMATSVPVPRAMPDVGLGQGRARR